MTTDTIDPFSHLVRGEFNTSLGLIKYQWNDANNCYLSAESLEIRGRSYRISFHVKRPKSGGDWEPFSSLGPGVHKNDSHGDSSHPIWKLVRDQLLWAWQCHVKSHPDQAIEAERIDIQHQIDNAESNIVALKEKIEEYVREMESLLARQAAL